MAVRNNTISFKTCQFYEEDGIIYIEEFTRDGSNVFALNDILQEFEGDDRFFDLTIKEKFDFSESNGG